MLFTIYGIMIIGVEGIYVGATIDFENRKSEHTKGLENGIHPTTELQKAYNQSKKLKFIILEEFEAYCSQDVCDHELKWMNDIKDEHGRFHLFNGYLMSLPDCWDHIFEKLALTPEEEFLAKHRIQNQ